MHGRMHPSIESKKEGGKGGASDQKTLRREELGPRHFPSAHLEGGCEFEIRDTFIQRYRHKSLYSEKIKRRRL